jgi:DnaJ-class molecular chaperone
MTELNPIQGSFQGRKVEKYTFISLHPSNIIHVSNYQKGKGECTTCKGSKKIQVPGKFETLTVTCEDCYGTGIL